MTDEQPKQSNIYKKINAVIQAVQYHENPYDAIRAHLLEQQLTIIPSIGKFTIYDAGNSTEYIECPWVTDMDPIQAHHNFITSIFMITSRNEDEPEQLPEPEQVHEDPSPSTTGFRPSPDPVFTKKERIQILKGSDIKHIHTIKNMFSSEYLARDPQHVGIITIDNKDILLPLTEIDLRKIETVCGFESYSLDQIKPSNDKTESIRHFSCPIAVTTQFNDATRKASLDKVVPDFRNPATLSNFLTLYADEQALLLEQALGCAVVDYEDDLQSAIQAVETLKKSIKQAS